MHNYAKPYVKMPRGKTSRLPKRRLAVNKFSVGPQSRYTQRMKKHHSQRSQKYHNRVARRYDNMYDDPYWAFHDRLTWEHVRGFLPANTSAHVMDLGCGTGKWGLKLLKMGYPTLFVDHAAGMLEQVRLKLAEWSQQPDLAGKAVRGTTCLADAATLDGVPSEQFDLLLAMGDVVSICSSPAGCLAAMKRVLRPGGVAIFTVDNLLAGLDHYAEMGDVNKLVEFAAAGSTQWLTNDKSEQFALQMFSPAGISKLAAGQGFSIVSMIGKTVLPVRKNRKLFENPHALEKMLKAESLLARDPAALGRAGHLQLAVRKDA